MERDWRISEAAGDPMPLHAIWYSQLLFDATKSEAARLQGM